jgi:hypothetical protein
VNSLIRSLARGAVIALYLTAAFAIVPALGTSADATSPDGSGPVTEGVLVAILLLIVTVGTALVRWAREESEADYLER